MLDDKNIGFINSYVDNADVRRCKERSSITKKKLSNVLNEGRLPGKGFSEAEIESFFLQLASLDSNNWDDIVGVGEREGRVLLNCIKRRHYGLTHGIGRSGDVTAIQPKATGSSLLNRLTNRLLLDWLRKSGSPSTANCFLVPVATGMSLALCLLLLKTRRPAGARFVVWPRIDQKSCFKSIVLAGLIPVPIDLISRSSSSGDDGNSNRDSLSYDLEELKAAVLQPAAYLRKHWPTAAQAHGITENDASQCGPETLVCVLTTTSCFAPRAPDRLNAVTRVCLDYSVGHLINNAYGVQSARYMRMIEAAGRLLIDAATATGETTKKANRTVSEDQAPLPIDLLYVQSTDKNMMVPVGGAIIAGFSSPLVTAVAKSYPGRASATPSMDVLATLLHLGSSGWSRLRHQQEACFARLQAGLLRLQAEHRPRLRLMATADNRISLAIGLAIGSTNTNLDDDGGPVCWSHSVTSGLTQLGSRLFTQGCSGVRIVLPSSSGPEATKELNGYVFPGYGSHSSTSQVAYMNVAAAVGQTEDEVDRFLAKLDKVLTRHGDAQD